MSTAMLRQREQARSVKLAVTPAYPSSNERPGRGPAFAYSVRTGDTLNAIARASGVPMAELMRRNPAMNGNHLRPGDRIWVPDLLPASAGEPALGLSQRTARGGEVRMSADRRFIAVLDSSTVGMSNSLTIFERKSGKRTAIPAASPDHAWKRIGWSPDGRLLAIEGLRASQTEGGTFIAFDPLTGEKATLLSPEQALEDLRGEGHCPDIVEIVSFRPVKDKFTYRLSLLDDRTDRLLYTDWVMSSKGTDRQKG